MSWAGRCLRAGAAVAGVAAVVPLAWWAAPSSHAPVRTVVYWPADTTVDGGRWLSYRIVRQGLDRAGYVYQERELTFQAPRGDMLEPIRHRPQVTLPPARPWLLQYTTYGINHVFARDGVALSDAGMLETVPYGLMATVLAGPAAAWLAVAGARQFRRQLQS